MRSGARFPTHDDSKTPEEMRDVEINTRLLPFILGETDRVGLHFGDSELSATFKRYRHEGNTEGSDRGIFIFTDPAGKVIAYLDYGIVNGNSAFCHRRSANTNNGMGDLLNAGSTNEGLGLKTDDPKLKDLVLGLTLSILSNNGVHALTVIEGVYDETDEKRGGSGAVESRTLYRGLTENMRTELEKALEIV